MSQATRMMRFRRQLAWSRKIVFRLFRDPTADVGFSDGAVFPSIGYDSWCWSYRLRGRRPPFPQKVPCRLRSWVTIGVWRDWARQEQLLRGTNA